MLLFFVSALTSRYRFKPCNYANLVNMVSHTAAYSTTSLCRSRATIISPHMVFTSGPIHQKSRRCRNKSSSRAWSSSCTVGYTSGVCPWLSASDCLTPPRIHCRHTSTKSVTHLRYHCKLVWRLQATPKKLEGTLSDPLVGGKMFSCSLTSLASVINSGI